MKGQDPGHLLTVFVVLNDNARGQDPRLLATFVVSAVMCKGRTRARGSMTLVMQGHVSDVPGAVAQIAMLSIAI